jgi:hypothetical protein
MAVKEYVVEIDNAKINMICSEKRYPSGFPLSLALEMQIIKCNWTTELAISRINVCNKYFMQRTGFSYPSFLINEPYGDIPHSCEAKYINFNVLRISTIERTLSDVPDQNSKIKLNV